MSYQVLARKWRPQNFKQMVGQEHVLRALMNALDSDRLHHAYLFTGTRGVGKTTIARILAKCLNCETGVTSTPCGECNSCKEIVTGNFLDLIEVDAASRTKVEDTRELLENVQYAPTRARFKVYLIDEVHMLTGHSFNALLKTLEEPPPHVKFLFATTDPQKLPATILSRCLQFNLKRMPIDMISGHLYYLLQQESIKFEESALRLLARAADGSMRDALSLLDQSIAYSGADITEPSVRDMLGAISHEPLIDLLTLIVAGDGAKLLHQVEDLASVTPDFAVATDALIALLHQLAVQQVVPDAINEDQGISELAKGMTKEEVQLFYQIALQGRRDLPLSPDPRSGFEMLLLRMLSFRPLREGMQLDHAKQSNPEDDSKKKTVISDQSREEEFNNAGSDNKEAANKEIVSKTLDDKTHYEDKVSPDNTYVAAPVVSNKKNDSSESVNLKAETNKHTEVPPWEDVPPYLDQKQNSAIVSTVVDKEINNIDTNALTQNTTDADETKTSVESDKQSDSIEDLILQTHYEEIPEESIVVDSIVVKSMVEEEIVEDVLLEENIEIDQVDEKISHNNFNSNQPWHEVVPQLKLSGRANELIKHCLLEKNENGMISLLLSKNREDLYAENTKLEIQTAITTLYGNNTSLELKIAESISELKPTDKILETPAQRSVRKVSESQQQAETNIENDPFIVELKNRFGAQVVPGSVQPKSH